MIDQFRVSALYDVIKKLELLRDSDSLIIFDVKSKTVFDSDSILSFCLNGDAIQIELNR